MRTESQIPVQYSTPQLDRPMKRHHTARYYAHRVKESLATRVSKLICSIFLALLFLVGIVTFILWLSLRPHRPRFHVEGFSIPNLGQEGGFQTAQIIYNVTARNSNQNIGVYYDSMQLAVFYEDRSIGGSPVLFPFYQEPKNTTVIAGTLAGASVTVTGQQWLQFGPGRARSEVVFRIEITSVIRFKISTWDSKRHKMHVNCPVGIGPDGSVLPSYTINRCQVYFN